METFNAHPSARSSRETSPSTLILTPLLPNPPPAGDEDLPGEWRLPLTSGCWPLPSLPPAQSLNVKSSLWACPDPFALPVTSSTNSVISHLGSETAEPQPLVAFDVASNTSLPSDDGRASAIHPTSIHHHLSVARARARTDSDTTLVPSSCGSTLDVEVWSDEDKDGRQSTRSSVSSEKMGVDVGSGTFTEIKCEAENETTTNLLDLALSSKTVAPITYLSEDDIILLLSTSRSSPPSLPQFDYFTHCPFFIQHRDDPHHAILPWLARRLLEEDQDRPATTSEYQTAQSFLRSSLPEEIAENEVVGQLLDEDSDFRVSFHGMGRALNQWVRGELHPHVRRVENKVETRSSTTIVQPLQRHRTPTSVSGGSKPLPRYVDFSKRRGKENRPPVDSPKQRRVITMPASARYEFMRE